MKFSKFCFTVATAVFAVGAFADAANVLISFSTDGSETYADGQSVQEGEWYALCWSPNETFGGLTTSCGPAVEGDEVIEVGPHAKKLSNGKVGCAPYLFQIDSKAAQDGGNYFVYLLDTRTVKDGKFVVAAEDEDTGLPETVNGAFAAKNYTASSTVGGNIASASEAAAKWAESAVTGEVTTAKIESINVAGAKVEINVIGMMPGLMYNVKMGDTPTSLNDYVIEMPKTGDTTATFKADKDDAKFFKVVRWPVSE